MKKVKEFINNNKNRLVVFGAILFVVLIIIVVACALIFKGEDKAKSYEAILKEMGKDFYENYYYDSLKNVYEKEEDFKKYLADYKDMGIRIDLDNLKRINSKVNEEKAKELINPKTNEMCDTKNTIIIIYPTGDYTKSEYTIGVELDCGLSEK